MWQAGVSLSVPVWSLPRREHARTEIHARVSAARASAEAIRCLLEQRVRERHALLAAVVDSIRIYRTGLLVQSEATVSSTLGQYRVGRVPLASVLDAMAGYVLDVNGFLESVVQAQRLAVAEREVSLADPGGGLPGLPAGGGAGMAGAAAGGGAGSSEGAGAAGSLGDASRGGAAASMSKM
jgi:cobalt-zinc-cadmium efflux system outer membrane protein